MPDSQASPMSPGDIAKGIAALIDPTTSDESGTSGDAGDEVTDETRALERQAAEQASGTVESEDEAGEDEEDAESTARGDFELVLQRQGEEYRVSDRDEATRLANLGLHFTRNNEEFLQAKRAFEGERQEVQQLKAQYGQVLPAIQEFLRAPLGERPTRDQFDTSDAFASALEAWDQGMAQVEQVRQEQQRLQHEQQQQATEALQRFLAEADTQTLALVPEWTDQTVLSAEVPRLTQYAIEQGIPQEWLQNPWVSRHPAFVSTLRKAWRFDEASAKGKLKVEEVRQKTKDAAPGPGGEAAVNQRVKNLRQIKKDIQERGGKVDDVSQLMGGLLDRQSKLERTR